MKIIENDDLNELEMGVRALFIYMILLADDEGRLKATPSHLKRTLSIEKPIEEVEHALGSLHARGLIKMYGSITRRYALIPNFRTYQSSSLNKPSELPAPCQRYPYLTVNPGHVDGPLWTVEVPNFPALVDEHFQAKYAQEKVELELNSVGTQLNSVGTHFEPELNSIRKQAYLQGSNELVEKTLLYKEHKKETIDRKIHPLTPSAKSSSVDAEDDAAFVDSVTLKLGEITDDEPRSAAEQLLWRAKSPHPKTKQRYPLAHWESAVDTFIGKVKRGNAPDGDAIGYIIGCVPGAGVSLSVKESAVGTARPESEMTPDELAALRLKRRQDKVRKRFNRGGDASA